MRKYKLFILLTLIFVMSISCQDQLNRRLILSITGITPDRTIVAQGESINIIAIVAITGAINSREGVVYDWTSEAGSFLNPDKSATVWTAPEDQTGLITIRLTVSFMGRSDEGNVVIRVVSTPADNYGSLSGNVLDELRNPMNDIIVSAPTGEADTTNSEGLFYLRDLPQGITSISFSNVGFNWMSDLPGSIPVAGGSHTHLGDILVYNNNPPAILRYELQPERQSSIFITRELPDLYQYHELFRSGQSDGSNASFVDNIAPLSQEFLIQDSQDSAYFAVRSIPNHGIPSDFSDWTKVKFVDVIDPDAQYSQFIYNNFFSATLFWEPTGYENYYQGFRVAEKNATDYDIISSLISASTFQYDIETIPGMTGKYYVMAYTKTGKFNAIQPNSQIIYLDVPQMQYPILLSGLYLANNTIRLTWEPVANNNAWYAGYLIQRTTVSNPSESDWSELARLTGSQQGSYIDDAVTAGTTYYYRIRTVAYPEATGSPAYSNPSLPVAVNAF